MVNIFLRDIGLVHVKNFDYIELKKYINNDKHFIEIIIVGKQTICDPECYIKIFEKKRYVNINDIVYIEEIKLKEDKIDVII